MADSKTPSDIGLQQVIEQQPLFVDLQPLNNGNQPRGDLNTGRGQQQLFIEQRQPCIEQLTAIEKPTNTRSNNTAGGRCILSCLACFVCVGCFWPTGIAAIVYALKAAVAYKKGNIEDCNRYYSKTQSLIIASIVIGTVVFAIFGIKHIAGSPYSTSDTPESVFVYNISFSHL